VIAAKGHLVLATRMNSANQVGKWMRQFSNVTNKSSRATWFVALNWSERWFPFASYAALGLP